MGWGGRGWGGEGRVGLGGEAGEGLGGEGLGVSEMDDGGGRGGIDVGGWGGV